MAIYTGTGQVQDTDVRYVKWVGKTKGGKEVSIELEKAICRSNPDWAFEEKNDTTAALEFEGLYTDENLAKTSADGITAGAGEIILRTGAFYVGTSSADAKRVGLTRGGGSFVVERTYRDINADDDPGSVEGRIDKTEGRPKLKFTALQWLTKVSDLYSCIKTVT